MATEAHLKEDQSVTWTCNNYFKDATTPTQSVSRICCMRDWKFAVRRGVVWCGVCGVVWCGVVWCDVVWCGVVCVLGGVVLGKVM